MKQIEFSWTGSENSEEGHAIFKCDGVTVLSLPFPEFKQAHVVCNAMNFVRQRGREIGIKEAKAAMLASLSNL